MDSRPHNQAADVRVFCGTGPGGFAHAPEAPALYQQPALHPPCTHHCTQQPARQPSPVPTYPVAAAPQRTLLSQDVRDKDSRQPPTRHQLAYTTYPTPPTLHLLPLKRCISSAVGRRVVGW
ncbi:hypothetical protein E4U31_007453 [Claviceps sp. LM219 group G6]|nr:hypothetical protein E4U31_007453 [Claviceps sp. LM219 group G6]